MYKQVLNCIVIELCKMVDAIGLKPLNNISFLKIKCYLCQMLLVFLFKVNWQLVTCCFVGCCQDICDSLVRNIYHYFMYLANPLTKRTLLVIGQIQMFLILQETRFQDQVLKSSNLSKKQAEQCKFIKARQLHLSSLRKLFQFVFLTPARHLLDIFYLLSLRKKQKF